MDDRVRGFENTLSFLREGREARRADGLGLEEAVLRHAPEIPSWEIGKCWPYEDWPGRVVAGMPRRDDGVDVVAEKRGGSLVAIQCKNRSGDGSVTARQVREFAGAAPEPVFAERWMVAEARRGRRAEEAAVVADVAFVDFEADLVGALEHTRASAAAVEDPRTAMQDRAVAACVEVLRAGLPEHRKRWLGEEPAAWMPREASRATLVMPGGTGKTRVSMRVMSELSGPGDLGVVLVPSIALICQVRRGYLAQIGQPVRTLAVCSDATAGHVDVERDPDLAADPTRDTGQV